MHPFIVAISSPSVWTFLKKFPYKVPDYHLRLIVFIGDFYLHIEPASLTHERNDGEIVSVCR